MNINAFSIVFIGGIHGVGKTVFSATASRILHLPHFSASRLISEHKKTPATFDKRVENIDENQIALIAGIESTPIGGKQFILDGHFCLLDGSDSVKCVPTDTFRALSPTSVVVLVDDVDIVEQRLKKRDGKVYGRDMLRVFQEEEVCRAEEVCSQLNTPLFIGRPSEHAKAIEFMAKHLREVEI